MNSAYNDEDVNEYIEEARKEENKKTFNKYSEHYVINPLRMYYDDNEQKMKVSENTLKTSLKLETDNTMEAILKMKEHIVQTVNK